MLQIPRFLLACALALPLAASAQEANETAAPAPASAKIEIGAATDAILTLQRSGLAAGTAQLIQGEVAARSHQRYLDAYKQPSAIGRVSEESTATQPATR